MSLYNITRDLAKFSYDHKSNSDSKFKQLNWLINYKLTNCYYNAYPIPVEKIFSLVETNAQVVERLFTRLNSIKKYNEWNDIDKYNIILSLCGTAVFLDRFSSKIRTISKEFILFNTKEYKCHYCLENSNNTHFQIQGRIDNDFVLVLRPVDIFKFTSYEGSYLNIGIFLSAPDIINRTNYLTIENVPITIYFNTELLDLDYSELSRHDTTKLDINLFELVKLKELSLKVN